jgi:hypothetical protein
MPGTSPIRFDLIGANERTRNALAMAFNGRAKGCCEFAVNGNADAVIVDLDGVGARGEWSRYRHRYPQRPSVLLTISECTAPETAIVLLKPVRVDALLSAVADVHKRIEAGGDHSPGATLRPPTNRIQQTVRAPPAAAKPFPVTPARNTPPPSASLSQVESKQSKKTVVAVLHGVPSANAKRPEAQPQAPSRDYRDVCGSAEDIDCDNPVLVQSRCFDADGTLLDCMRRAVARSGSTRVPVSLVIQDREMVTVCAQERTCRIAVTDDILRQLCTRKFPVNQMVLRNAVAEQLHSANGAAGEVFSLEALLWKTALWTYQGRLPANTPIREKVYLRRWPNLTRLVEVPEAMRIAALLSEQPLALPRVAEALAIAQRYVFAFYGAAHASGLVSQVRREADRTAVTPTLLRQHREHGFLGRVVGKLKRLVA